MNERITLISLFDEENNKKLKGKIKDIDSELCKVPYGKKVENRKIADTLPYHFTLFSWSIKKKKEVVDYLDNMKFSPFKITINQVKIITGEENSFELRFCMEKNSTLLNLQSFLYAHFKTEYYNPNTFQFHITIHCDKDKKKIEKMEQIIKETFSPFSLEIKKFALYEIWNTKLIKIVSKKR